MGNIMDVLHILRSEPDETTRILIQNISGDQAKTLPLYTDDVDWDKVVDQIFAHTKVISWW